MIKIQINHTWDNSKIIQTSHEGIQYSFLSKNNEQVCPFVFCKDFLHDIVYSTVNRMPIDIYKFRYNPFEDPPLNLEETTLILKFQDENFNKKNEIVDFINKFEKKMKFNKSHFENCSENGCIVIYGDKRWMFAPPLISLYALLIRIGCSHKKSDSLTKTILKVVTEDIEVYHKNDKDYLLKSIKGIDNILTYGYDIFAKKIERKQQDRLVLRKNYPKKVKLSKMHHDGGILAYSSGVSKKKFPQWYPENDDDWFRS